MMSANLHDVRSVEAISGIGTSWLEVASAGGCRVAIFMPMEIARAMAEAFNAAADATHQPADAAE